MATKSGFAVSRDDMSLPSWFAVWLASLAADWVGGRLLWSNWDDVDELALMKDEILSKNELVMLERVAEGDEHRYQGVRSTQLYSKSVLLKLSAPIVCTLWKV